MIDRIMLANFKCFEVLDLELAPLTLLTGFNAAGKSTAIQTLLLLAQTLRGQRGPAELRLNGPLVSLGTPGDVINTRAGINQLELGIAAAGVELRWHFAVPDMDRRSLQVSRLEIKTDESSSVLEGQDLDGIRPLRGDDPVGQALSFVDGLVFLSAARQVETEVFPFPQDFGLSRGDVGPIGQFAPWWLHQEGDSDVSSERCCKSDTSVTLRHQTNAWTGDLFPGTEINAVPVQRTNLMRLELRSGRTSDWSRPANIGYGISYALPILIAALCAEQTQTLILDSPEAHLHPRGQSRIGGFLAQMASAGVQMLAETHSDHVLNGIRVALREGTITPDKVAIYFFTTRTEAPVVRLSVDKNGTISDWPEGFFDQSERDLGNLAGWE